MPSLVVFGVIVVLTYVLYYARRLRAVSKTFPPGPPARFLIGNLHDIPTGEAPWKEYRDMGETYGPVIFLRALGKSILILNSIVPTTALLDKEGAIYSSRPRFTLINDLLGWGWNMIFMPYGEQFISQRRILQHPLQASVIADKYQPVIAQQVQKLLENFTQSPQNYEEHLHNYTVGVILLVTYGHTIAGHDDALLKVMHDIDLLQADLGSSTYLVDLVPALKYVPAWFPGASFKHLAQRWRDMSDRVRELPYAMVKKKLDAGTATPCIASTLIENSSLGGPREQDLVKDSLGVIYAAGSDTTFTALMTFIFAMLLHPEVQKKAQDELDCVTGGTRLPEISDRSELPYIDCILKEVFRWHPVAPLGIPHATMKASSYNGHYIPPDTMVITNIWAILHDPTIYADPECFYPERFLDANVLDPARAVFGFGRRICPGRHFADMMLWMAAASVLAEFTISAPKELKPPIQFRTGMVSAPKAFECRIQARSRTVVSG